MATRALRGLLLCFLLLTLVAGASGLCLAADLCAHGTAWAPTPADEAAEHASASDAGCHRPAGGSEPPAGPVAAGAGGECCAGGVDETEAKVDKRDRLARWIAAPLIAVEGVAVEGRSPSAPAELVEEVRTATARPAFLLHAALLL